MTSDAFLRRLRRGLHGFPNDEIEEIVGDYASHFSESVADGRSEAEVAEALGDPDRIAREIRADRGLRRFEQHWSLTNLFAALMALCGLAIVDLFFLLPLLLVVVITAFALTVVLLALSAAGLKIMITAVLLLPGMAVMDVLASLFIGAGLISCLIGGGALLLMGMGAGVRIFGHYARLHFRVLQQERREA